MLIAGARETVRHIHWFEGPGDSAGAVGDGKVAHWQVTIRRSAGCTLPEVSDGQALFRHISNVGRLSSPIGRLEAFGGDANVSPVTERCVASQIVGQAADRPQPREGRAC